MDLSAREAELNRSISSPGFVRPRGAFCLAAGLLAFIVAPALVAQTNAPAAMQGVPAPPTYPPVAEVLKGTSAAYSGMKSYTAQITVQTVDGTKVTEQHFDETGSAGAYRIDDKDSQGLLRVSDGRSEWALDRRSNEYAKSPSTNGEGSFIEQFAHIDQNVKDASVDDEELYTVNGMPTKVYIVEVTRTAWPASSPADAQSALYSIDEKTFEVYKSITYTNTATQVALYSIKQRNQPVASSEFSAAPPTSAKEVSSLTPAAPTFESIIGMAAPDFTLQDDKGKSYKLSDFRGKVVVIDFVGSWCPPCLAQMPYLQQVFDAYPEKDLMVFGLDVGEDQKEVDEFGFNTAFSFPLLLGAEPTVTTPYFVDDYPTTYIIDRTGHIVFKATGTDNPGGFLAALKVEVAKRN